MALQDALARIERAEHCFELLGVEHDPRVLAVYRLRLLKRFGMEIAEIEERRAPADETERRHLYAEALRRIHEEFTHRAASDAPPPVPGVAVCGTCRCG
jgi:nitrogenase-stabilizing/protective protein